MTTNTAIISGTVSGFVTHEPDDNNKFFCEGYLLTDMLSDTHFIFKATKDNIPQIKDDDAVILFGKLDNSHLLGESYRHKYVTLHVSELVKIIKCYDRNEFPKVTEELPEIFQENNSPGCLDTNIVVLNGTVKSHYEGSKLGPDFGVLVTQDNSLELGL
ncbi:MAG: hypothetical protein ACD_20C00362G0002 [uncultured bacterium]|nr:MAG: hypothetical protein ACD_20C00362G0002 [uncultured bacterium]